MYYVYALLDSGTEGPFKYGRYTFSHQPFYIGKGKGDRYLHHIRNVDKYKLVQNFKNCKIKSIIKKGNEVLVRILKEGLLEDDAFNLEKYMIDKIGRRDLGLGPLTNLTFGGEGGSGRKDSLKTKHLRKEMLLNRTAEEWEAIVEKRKSTIASKSPKQIKAWMDKLSKATVAFAKENPEEFLKRYKKQTRTKQNWSEDERKAFRETASVNSTIMHLLRSEKEKERVYKKTSKSLSNFYKTASSEYLDSFRASVSAGVTKWAANLSPKVKEEANEKRRNTWANKSDAEIKEMTRKRMASRERNKALRDGL